MQDWEGYKSSTFLCPNNNISIWQQVISATVTISTFLELLLPLYIAYYYTAYSWEVVLLVTAYGGPSTVNTEVHAFRVLRRYLTHIRGTEISFGNHLIIPLVTKGGRDYEKGTLSGFSGNLWVHKGRQNSDSIRIYGSHTFVSHTMALIWTSPKSYEKINLLFTLQAP